MDAYEIELLLSEFGFTSDETKLYLLLIEKKSLTVQELIKNSYFSKKRRPNLYKILNNMEKKKLIYSEVKKGKSIFFPFEPSTTLSQLFLKKEEDLIHLKLKTDTLIEFLEHQRNLPNPQFNSIKPPLIKYFEEFIPKTWIIKETPIEITENPQLGKISSLEFDTQRKFSGSAAGLIIHQFRYPEHIEQVYRDIIKFELANLKDALENLKDKGFFSVRKYIFSEANFFSSYSQKKYSVYEFLVHLNLGIKGKGNIMTFCSHAYPNEIICLWASNVKDFELVLQNFEKKIELYQF